MFPPFESGCRLCLYHAHHPPNKSLLPLHPIRIAANIHHETPSFSAEPPTQSPCATKAYRDHSISPRVRSTFFVFQFIISSNLDRHTVLFCATFTPLTTKTLGHCVLPPANSEATSMTLRAQSLLQAPKPHHTLCKKKLCVSLFGSLVVIGAMCPHHEK